MAISRVVCEDCNDCDDYVAVWEFTDVAVAERTGWTDTGGIGFDGFDELLESVLSEFTTVFWPDVEVLVDEVTAIEEVEDAEDAEADEVEVDACPWLWIIPETELVTVEVDGLLVWYYAWVYVVTVLRLVKFPWRILFWK